MKKNNRNYMLLVGFGQPEESEYQKRARLHEENFLQFTRRTRAGVPLVSEQEKIYERETEAQRERRLGLFWDSFPLIMRNWKTVLRYPLLSGISMDPLCLVYGMKGVTLGSLVLAWRARHMRTVCPKCGGNAHFLPYMELPFPGPWSMPEGFPEKTHVYCSDCGAETHLYDYEYDPESKCRDFRHMLEKAKRCRLPGESEMTFERAMHLLKLCEIYGDPPKEITG